MCSLPFSLRPDLPALDDPRFVFAGAHLVSDQPGVRNALALSRIDALLTLARHDGWSVNLLDTNSRKLILTFDDGRCFPSGLADVLDAHDATAIFFVCTAQRLACYPDSPAYDALTDENRRYLLERHIVGGHTHAHVNLGELRAALQRPVLERSSERFSEWFGFPPRCFSYPWGRYRGATLCALRVLGVRFAFLGRAGWRSVHPYLIPRVFLDTGEWGGDLGFLQRKRREALSNGKLMLRRVHAGVHLATS